jgi:hypothetical protein
VVKDSKQLHVGEPVTLSYAFLGLSDNLYLLSLLTAEPGVA